MPGCEAHLPPSPSDRKRLFLLELTGQGSAEGDKEPVNVWARYPRCENPTNVRPHSSSNRFGDLKKG